MAVFLEMPLHDGEVQMRRLMNTPFNDNPTVPGLSAQLSHHLQVAPLIAIGALDSEQRPWTTLWGGQQDMARALGGGIVGIRTPVASRLDPVVEMLVGDSPSGAVTREPGNGRLVSGLTIDLQTRKRVKMSGRMVAGALSSLEADGGENAGVGAEVQLVVRIEQSLGNCPKYINSRPIEPVTPQPVLLSDSVQLPGRALGLLAKADLFFVSSSYNNQDMDTNHRGGPAGFVRVVSNSTPGAVLCWPEYSGNRLYQTLGNLKLNPKAGICVPDFETGDMLYITGTTDILVGEQAAELLPRSNLCVRLTVTAARFVGAVLPFRGGHVQPSPYNPSVRFLACEKSIATAQAGEQSRATLVEVKTITSDIARFRFTMPKPVSFHPGQYVTLDFSEHLDLGYSHMRDDDPRSLNDDYVRTFTVSSSQKILSSAASEASDKEFEITIRNVGVVTAFLFKHSTDRLLRQPLEVAVRGFGGEFTVEQNETETIGFIAGGVGITPLLPSLQSLDLDRLKVLWTVRSKDVGLVQETLRQYPSLGQSIQVFITGGNSDVAADAALEKLQDAGASVISRRIGQDDFTEHTGIDTYYLCASPALRKNVLEWLPTKTVKFEDFGF